VLAFYLKRKEYIMSQVGSRSLAVSETRINTFLGQVYLVMSLGLVVTGLMASWTSQNQELLLKTLRPGFAFGLFILQIVIVVALSASVMRMSPAMAGLLFIVYSALTGLTFGSLFLIYTESEIAQVFWLTAGTFFLTSLFGILFKRDLSSAGNVLFMLLLGWTLAWMFSWFFPGMNMLLTFIGIALFVGLTAYDTQRLKEMGKQLDSHPARGGLIVMGALTLYLDFINLFLLILRASRR
jgi:FtsH-binding integral membrane protein